MLAQVVEFKKASTDRLVQRLKAICRAEGINASQDALMALISMTDNDIRSCLHTLQFIKRKLGTRRVMPEDLVEASIGMKDSTGSLFDAWTALFKTPSAKRSRTQQAIMAARQRMGGGAAQPQTEGLDEMGSNPREEHLRWLFSSMASFGAERSKLVEGVHENALKVGYHDPTMGRTAALCEYLSEIGQMEHRIASRQEFYMGRYITTALAQIHLTTNTDARPKLVFPRTAGQMRHLQGQKRSIIQTFMHGRANGCKDAGEAGALNVTLGVTDLVPFILHIVNPPLRPVNFTLLNSKEKSELYELVMILATNQLTFRPSLYQQHEFGDNVGQPKWVLEPEIHELTDFPSGQPVVRHEMPDILKQMVAREVRMAMLRLAARARAAEAQEEAAGEGTEEGHALPDHIRRQLKDYEPTAEELASEKAQAAKAQAHEANTGAAAWSFLASGAGGQPVKRKSKPHSRFAVLFRYQEGFTNAVRRPVYFKDLM